MSIERCSFCDKNIDTDKDCEHWEREHSAEIRTILKNEIKEFKDSVLPGLAQDYVTEEEALSFFSVIEYYLTLLKTV